MADPYFGLTGIPNPTSAAGQGLGLGTALGQQTQDEIEERKRRQQMGLPEPGQSEAVRSLFSSLNAGLGGGLGQRGKGF
jgi:hypothetical protein